MRADGLHCCLLQLRPKAESYKLRTANWKFCYNLDTSLFERLANSERRGVPVHTLQSQRRMHPEISQLVRLAVYPTLKDATEVVGAYPPVKGFPGAGRLIWLDHTEPEDGARAKQAGDVHEASRSASNKHEAEWVVAIVKYLLLQGYAESDEHGRPQVVVLTPYVGQLKLLMTMLRQTHRLEISDKDKEELERAGLSDDDSTPVDDPGDDLGDGPDDAAGDSAPGGGGHAKLARLRRTALSASVRVATVDNFQGEEANVVVISMTRSRGRSIGFLAELNRVNVMLSRARHGMIMVGNADHLRSRCRKTWAAILDHLDDEGVISPVLTLACPNHPDNERPAGRPEDIDLLAPDGGCMRRCAFKLPCGHVCRRWCHTNDPGHTSELAMCEEACLRLRPCGHACSRLCGEDCGVCDHRMGEEQGDLALGLPCGHTMNSYVCHQAQSPSTVKCEAPTAVIAPDCGHENELPCHQAVQVERGVRPCALGCDWALPCGHKCPNPKCCVSTVAVKARKKGKQSSGTVSHMPCTSACGRTHQECGHICKLMCHEHKTSSSAQPGGGDSGGAAVVRICPPCQQTCDNRCVHGRCEQLCSAECMPCLHPCTWECPHAGKCELPCGVPCVRAPCDKRCTKELECGHQCPSVCGERCPDRKYCLEPGCSTDEDVARQVVDYVEFTPFADHTLETTGDLLLVLPCGHACTVETLDNIAGMGGFFQSQSDEYAPLTADAAAGTGADDVLDLTAAAPLSALSCNHWIGVKPRPQAAVTTPQCPTCRHRICDVQRYNRPVKTGVLNMLQKQMLLEWQSKLLHAQHEIESLDHKLGNGFANAGAGAGAGTGAGTGAGAQLLPTTCEAWQAIANATDWLDPAMLGLERVVGLKPEPVATCDEMTTNAPPFVFDATETVAQLLRDVIHSVAESPLKRLYDGAQVAMMKVEDAATVTSLDVGACADLEAVRSVIPNTCLKPALQARVLGCHVLSRTCMLLLRWLLDSVPDGTPKPSCHKRAVQSLSAIVRRCERTVAAAAGEASHAKLATWASQLATQRCHMACGWIMSLIRCSPAHFSLASHTRDELKQWLEQLSKEPRVLSECRDVLARAQEGLDTAVGISDAELREVVQAMQPELGRTYRGNGHWYQCPNGHIYTIGECGGAMEQSRCPECGAAIGGGSHTLVGGNAPAHRVEGLRPGDTYHWRPTN